MTDHNIEDRYLASEIKSGDRIMECPISGDEYRVTRWAERDGHVVALEKAGRVAGDGSGEPAESGRATPQYEYRIFGKVDGEWRATRWGTEQDAIDAYTVVHGRWGLLTFERRERGDDTTLQRKPVPDADEWTQVTEEAIHVADEEVAEVA